ncbi:MAG: DeoR family transcriptional regulator [Oscillospiraceae bacterium]|nr:DeoR family transcriptional regulator [Oscillospiraceae bacterium]
MTNGIRNGVRSGVTNGAINGAIKANRLEQIINVIESDSKVTITSISEMLGVPKRTIDRDIAALKKQNKIRHISPTKAGDWVIINSQKK